VRCFRHAIVRVVLILGSKRFLRAIAFGARDALRLAVAVGVVRIRSDIAERIRLRRQVACCVVTKRSRMVQRVRRPKQKPVRGVGICRSHWPERVLGGQQVSTQIIRIRGDIPVRIGNRQKLLLEVERILGGHDPGYRFRWCDCPGRRRYSWLFSRARSYRLTCSRSRRTWKW